MKTKKSKLSTKTETDIKFKYELEGAGWSKAYLKIGDAEVVFTSISYLCLPVTDLLTGLLSMIEEWDVISRKGKDVEITNAASVFTWEDEPGGYTWKLERHGRKNLRIHVTNLYDDESRKANDNKIVLDKIVDFKTFLTVILKQIDLLVKEYGLLGFRGNWVTSEMYQQFPLSQFLELKHYLIHNKILYIEFKGKTKNWSLKEELALLDVKI